MASVQVEIPEELYNSLKALGYQKKDIERELLEDDVVRISIDIHAFTDGESSLN